MAKIVKRLSASCLEDKFLPLVEIEKEEVDDLLIRLSNKYKSRRTWTTENSAQMQLEVADLMKEAFALYRNIIFNKTLAEAIRSCHFLLFQSFSKDHFMALTGHSLDDFGRSFTDKSQKVIKYFSNLTRPPLNLQNILLSEISPEMKVLQLIACHFNENLDRVILYDDVRF